MSEFYVKPGVSVSFAKTVSESDIYLFAGITGDFAVNHVNEQYMARSKYGRRMGPTCLYVLLAKHARAARLRGPIFPHALRHTYATHLLKGKAGIRHVQELLGHQSLQSTVVYTRVGVEDLRQVLLRAHPREWRWRRRK